MTEFVFLPPAGGAAPNKNLAEKPKEEPQQFTKDAGSEKFVFLGAPEEKKPSFVDKNGMAIAAGTGAAAGAYMRHKGAETSNLLKSGQNVYQPSDKSVEAINQKLRQVTGDPTIDVRGMTPQQIERILQGGEGSTHGTTGAQRMYGFQGEQQRKSRYQKEIESLVSSLHPNAPDPIAQAGQLVPLKSGIQVPVDTAQQVSSQQYKNTDKAIQDANKELKMAGIKSGAAKVGMGTAGGALTGLQAYGMATQDQPADLTQYLSLLGNLGITFGGKILGPLGAAAQIPYAVKHREDLMRGMTMNDINPTGMPLGTVGSGESPLQEPSRLSINPVLQKEMEDKRKKMFYSANP